jgi:hypothetical protein
MARTLRRMADGDDREASPEERMRRIDYLDLVRERIRWVLEGGIVLLSRSTRWIMLSCGPCCVSGCVMGCCYA